MTDPLESSLVTRPTLVLRLLGVVVGIAFAISLTACQAEGFVDVDVASDGSGSVTVAVHLDKEAVSRVGDLSKVVKTDDLRDAGWAVTAPKVSDEGVTFRARKPFGSPEGLQSVLTEVAGANVFDGWGIAVTDRFGSTTVAVKGSIRLDGSLDQVSDADLASALDGLPLGRTPEELSSEGGGAPPELPLTVRVRLPAEVDDSNGAPTADSSVRKWRVVIGDGQATTTELSASASSGGSLPVMLLTLAGVALVSSAALAVVTRRRRSLPRT